MQQIIQETWLIEESLYDLLNNLINRGNAIDIVTKTENSYIIIFHENK